MSTPGGLWGEDAVGQSMPLEWLALVEHELLLFSAVFFLIGALDEFVVDLVWIWLRLSGRAQCRRIDRREARERPLAGPAAVFIPAWHEDQVIGFTVAHALSAWPQAELRLYVGCYRNDPATAEAAVREADERREGHEFRLVALHDAEDMVDPAALGLFDRAIDEADFVQLPVLPEAQRGSRFVGSHYCDEFVEQHARVMVVRAALSAGLPAAGVGCAFDRTMLGVIARRMGGAGPFSIESLTEDYELGLRIKAFGGRSLFLRARGEDGQLVATRACFPPRFDAAVRQKSRWIHGIALQGWDRLGWNGGFGESWMRLRDRRGPLSALVLFVGYTVFALAAVLFAAGALGFVAHSRLEGWLVALLWANLAAFVWRAAVRFVFTAREYGWAEGLWAVARIPVSNLIAIAAGKRALLAYVRTLLGEQPRWEKTFHDAHPAAMTARGTTR